MPGPKKLFCFGYGYTCNYLGHALGQLPREWSLAGTTRDEERFHVLENRGIQPYFFDRDQGLVDAAGVLQDITHLLISTPPGDDGDPAFLMHGADIACMPNLEWVGYLSTTGVYGDREGRWVDETASVTPASRRGIRRAKAEEQWRSLMGEHDLPLHIFRLSGIYGPGRSALDSVRAGIARRIVKRGHAFGRIHVEDIVNVLLKSFQNPAPGEVYNLCDDKPVPSHEVIAYACELLGKPPPPLVDFEDADLAPMTRSFYMENRRVRNDKIKRDLSVEMKYSDFKAGLRGCLEAEKYAGRDAVAEDQTPSIFKK